MLALGRAKRLLAELRRRNVLKVAAGYIVFAWLALQVLNVLTPILLPPVWLQRAILIALAIGLLITLALSWRYDLTPLGFKRTQAMTALRPSTAPGVTSIAVLPFTDLSATRDQEYFGDGLAEELLNVLVRAERLSVASRTSSFAFKGKALPLSEIASALQVQHIVEGSVRRSGDHIRVAVELIDVSTDRELWARIFDRELTDVFAIQDEIAREIATALRVELKPGDRRARTQDVAAYDLYLLGMYHWNQRTAESLPRALTFFQQAVERDPGFALAWAGQALDYIVLARYAGFEVGHCKREALAAARKAVELDPGSVEAHTALGGTLFFDYGQLEAARAAFERALAINPNFATTHHWFGMLLTTARELATGETQLRMAHALDPASLPIQSYLGINLAHQRRWNEALLESEAVVRRAPDYTNTLVQSFLYGAMLGRGREFLPRLQRYFEVTGEDPQLADRIIAGAQVPDRCPGPAAELAAIAQRHRGKSHELHQLAGLLSLLQARAPLLEVLELTTDESDTMALYPYDFLRGEPRYEAIVTRKTTPLPALHPGDAALPHSAT